MRHARGVMSLVANTMQSRLAVLVEVQERSSRSRQPFGQVGLRVQHCYSIWCMHHSSPPLFTGFPEFCQHFVLCIGMRRQASKRCRLGATLFLELLKLCAQLAGPAVLCMAGSVCVCVLVLSTAQRCNSLHSQAPPACRRACSTCQLRLSVCYFHSTVNKLAACSAALMVPLSSVL